MLPPSGSECTKNNHNYMHKEHPNRYSIIPRTTYHSVKWEIDDLPGTEILYSSVYGEYELATHHCDINQASKHTASNMQEPCHCPCQIRKVFPAPPQTGIKIDVQITTRNAASPSLDDGRIRSSYVFFGEMDMKRIVSKTVCPTISAI